MSEILPGLILGDNSVANDTDFIRRNKITCIVNCTYDLPFPTSFDGVRFRIPLRDNGKEAEIMRTYKILDQCTESLYGLLLNHRVLVHCQAGRQRSVTIIAAFLMRYGQLKLQEALDYIRARHGIIGLNFSQALAHYQLDLMR